jgi:hypothetical protein
MLEWEKNTPLNPSTVNICKCYSWTRGLFSWLRRADLREQSANLHDQPRQKLTPSKHLEMPSNICAGEADPSLIVMRAKRRGVGVSAPSVRCHDRL